MDMTNPKIVIPIETGSSKPHPRNTLTIPQKCPACGFKNFNIWGTTTDDNLRIEVRCMRCGKKAHSLKHNLTSQATAPSTELINALLGLVDHHSF